MKNKNDAERWLKQAEEDFETLNIVLEKKKYYMACFLAQQVGEKAAKGVMYFYGMQLFAMHSVYGLLKALQTYVAVPEELLRYAKRLDKYYIPTRYPDAFPDEIPANMFDEEEAQASAEYAKALLDFARKIVRK